MFPSSAPQSWSSPRCVYMADLAVSSRWGFFFRDPPGGGHFSRLDGMEQRRLPLTLNLFGILPSVAISSQLVPSS